MKSNKGITLVSVTIYVIAMVMIVTLISVITGYFYKNVDINNETYDTSQQYTRFNSFFSDEINRNNNKIVEIGNSEGQEYIVFSSGNQYTFIAENKSIYKNNVKIATNIQTCSFTSNIVNGKETIKVKIGIGKNKIETNTTYTLNN